MIKQILINSVIGLMSSSHFLFILYFSIVFFFIPCLKALRRVSLNAMRAIFTGESGLISLFSSYSMEYLKLDMTSIPDTDIYIAWYSEQRKFSNWSWLNFPYEDWASWSKSMLINYFLKNAKSKSRGSKNWQLGFGIVDTKLFKWALQCQRAPWSLKYPQLIS